MTEEKFKKFDAGKVDYSLFEPLVMEMYCQVAQMGATKYGRRNWTKATKQDSHRYLAAALRHLMAHMNGELKDKESGLPHLSHAMWNLVAVQYVDNKEEKNESSQSTIS